MSEVNSTVAAAIGENLDALITIDLRGYHVGRILYRAARESVGEPLTLAAGRAIHENVSSGDTVVVATGFPFLPYKKPELDGIVGTAVVARALAILGAHPIVVTDPVTVPAMRELMIAAGVNLYDSPEQMLSVPHSGAVISFTTEVSEARGEADLILDAYAPRVVLAIEKPGANENGVYHQGNGADVSSMVAKTDALFELATTRNLPTIAIGDLGNELGFGGLANVLEQETPFGQRYVKASTGSIAATVDATHVLACSVSDWGAYALAAMLAFLSGNWDALHTPSIQRQLLWTAVRNGALDGSGRGEPAVDGIGEDYNARLISTMRDIIEITNQQSKRYEKIIGRLEDLNRTRQQLSREEIHA
jgi:hypothetical protein